MKTILYLGRIHYFKGIDLLLDAFQEFRGLDVRLLIVGNDDGQLAEVKSLIKQYGLSYQVEYHEAVYDESKWELYRKADLFATTPREYDAFPITVFEAISCGTLVVITDRCGVRDYIVPLVGEVVTPKAHPLALAIGRLLSRTNTAEDKLQRQTYIKGFTWSNTAEKVEAIYNEIIG